MKNQNTEHFCTKHPELCVKYILQRAKIHFIRQLKEKKDKEKLYNFSHKILVQTVHIHLNFFEIECFRLLS